MCVGSIAAKQLFLFMFFLRLLNSRSGYSLVPFPIPVVQDITHQACQNQQTRSQRLNGGASSSLPPGCKRPPAIGTLRLCARTAEIPEHTPLSGPVLVPRKRKVPIGK